MSPLDRPPGRPTLPLEYSLPNSKVALLGLLSERAKHAWQIEKDVEHRNIRSWTDLSQSTVYRQLTSPAKVGLVDPAEALVALRAYCAKLKDKIRCFKETEEYMSSSNCPAHRLAVV